MKALIRFFKIIYILPTISSIVFAQTDVSGIISTDTTWTLSGSPYYVIDDVQVPSGVTLTIEPGVEIQYTDAYEILIQGTIIGNGTVTDSITFTSFVPGVSSGATLLRFSDTDLESSQLNYLKMEYSSYAIRIAAGNIGKLSVTNFSLRSSTLITDGGTSDDTLFVSNAFIIDATIKGSYPNSGRIIIENATISNTDVNSDSYARGIILRNSSVTGSQLTIGCCSAQMDIENSTIVNSNVQNGGGSPVNGPFTISSSTLINTPINLPSAYVSVSNSVINYTGSNGLIFGNGFIENSQLIGNDNGVAVKITGYSGYNIGGTVTISNSTIMQNLVGIQITNANVITIQNNNIIDNATYNIENLSAQAITATYNWWGTADSVEIAATIFDYYDDINYGIVDYSNYLTSPDTDAPISPPTNVVKSASGSDVQLSWSANQESDLAGYKVYYGSPTGYSFDNMVDVGNVTSYILSGVTESDTIAITAYDNQADGTDDQIEGHESWFTYAGEAAPEISLSTTSLDFNVVEVGQSAQQTFVIQNDGTADLIVSDITSSNAHYTVSPTSFSVSPGNTQIATVVFTPTATGAEGGTLSINHNADGSPSAISVTGVGVPSAGTGVSGIISSGETWTLSGSPYYVIDDVQVPSGVTLTIEPGVEIQYTDAYEILIQGTIIGNGTVTDSITFTSFVPGVSSGATLLRFSDTDLESSQLNYLKMEYSSYAIRIAAGNIGKLSVTNFSLRSSTLITDGGTSDDTLFVSNAFIIDATIKGSYPNSGRIIIENATISNTDVNSDSYARGIILRNSSVTGSQLTIGCCSAQMDIENSTIVNSNVQNGGGSPVNGPFTISSSTLINTPINLPSAYVSVSNSVINYTGSNGLIFGNGFIENSQLIGNDNGVAVKITGYSGYNIGGTVTISNSTIMQNLVGIQITNANVITIQNNNIIDNATYNIENLSAQAITATYNWWGTADSVEIAATIFDYYDDINYGIVDYSNYLTSPDTDAPISPPTNVVKSASGSDVQLSWSANQESDLAGYKVYYGSPTGYSFDNMVDVGNVTSYILSGVTESDTIAITAYDNQADGTDDQIEGHESWFAIATTTMGIKNDDVILPTTFALKQNFPNPFNPVTTISYQLPKSTFVNLSIYNVVGQLVETLVNEHKNVGYYSVEWNASNVGTGIYFYRIKAGESSAVKKCLVLK